MNGARSTFMRKGYLLTALAAAVLLAASPGTAQAQLTATADFGEGGVKVDVPATVAEGNSATITVSAKAAVAADTALADRTVTVTLSLAAAGTAPDTREPEDAQFNPSGVVTLVFPANDTPADGTAPDPMTHEVERTISLQTTHDPDAEDENVVLEVTATGGLTPTIDDKTTKIDDDETQTYTLTLNAGQAPRENGTAMLTLKADPAHVDGMASLTVQNSDPVNYSWDTDSDATNNPNPILIGVGGDAVAEQTITITAPENDKNRETDSVTLTAYSGSAGDAMVQASATVDFVDIHVLPDGDAVTAAAADMDGEAVMEIMEGGDAATLTIMVDRGTGMNARTSEALSVSVEAAYPAQANDFRLSPTMVELPGTTVEDGKETAATTLSLSAVTDEDVGAEDLMLSLVLKGHPDNGEGSSTGSFSISIVDATEKKIEPKTTEADYDKIRAAIAAGAGEDGLNPGEMVEIMTDDVFAVADGYTASYGVRVDGDAVSASASGAMVTLTADKAGESIVYITGTASMAGSSLEASQDVSNVAEVKFPVTVVNTPLMVTVAADPLEIDEGGTSTITATASREVLEDDGTVTVDLELVGDAELDSDSITIAAGSMSGSVMLTASEDDDYDNETITVIASGAAEGRFDISVTDNDEAPAPIELTLEVAGHMDGNVVEGQSYDVHVTASRAVDEDTEITFGRDRSASDADEDDYNLAGVTMAAGEDTAMATLEVLEDMVDDAGHADGEVLVIYAMGGGAESNDVMLTLWDTAVPALPLIGQLVLALFLALGGARLYRRRQG